ncbi:MAG: hypothetical protein ACRDT0_23970 [Pseudonocardiaceae bacterium]
MFEALQARGHALLGDQHAVHAVLRNAETNLARSDSAEPPMWLTYFTEAELAAHTAYCLRDLGHTQRVEPEARSALTRYDPALVRSRVFMHTVLAGARISVQRPDLEGACAEAGHALHLVKNVRSTRGTEHLAGFVHSLEPFQTHPVARNFIERASETLNGSTPGHPT